MSSLQSVQTASSKTIPLPITTLSSPSHTPQPNSTLSTQTIDQSSPNPPLLPPPLSPLPQPNLHPMTTRSKAGIFKPKIYLAASNEPFCPTTIRDALADTKWKMATEGEYALIQFGTWEIAEASPNKKILGCKWLSKIKTNAEGIPVKRKARLVAKSFSQEVGCDYIDTFSLVVKPSTIRILLILEVTTNWKVHQLVFNNVFLN